MRYQIITDDELKHYGVIGMKWGRHRVNRLTKKADNITLDNEKLSKKLDKYDKKSVKVQARLYKERDRLERKRMFAIRRKKIDKIDGMLEIVDNKIFASQRASQVLNTRIEMNKRMRDTLLKKVDGIKTKHENKYLDEILNSGDPEKIARMKKEYAKK